MNIQFVILFDSHREIFLRVHNICGFKLFIKNDILCVFLLCILWVLMNEIIYFFLFYFWTTIFIFCLWIFLRIPFYHYMNEWMWWNGCIYSFMWGYHIFIIIHLLFDILFYNLVHSQVFMLWMHESMFWASLLNIWVRKRSITSIKTKRESW